MMNNENISNFDTIPIDLFIPDKIKLATVVKNELSTSFGEVTAEWVDCPDLTQEPFNLAAPGLGGDATLLDIGGTANIFPFRQLKIYDFKNILNQLNRSQNNNFIIGGGLSTQPMTLNYGHLIMNGTFAPVANEIIAVSNKSRFAFRNRFNDQDEEEQFALEILNNPFSKCHMYGNFFVSQGLREQVLKVEAKERTGHDFIDAIQRGISRIFPSKLFSNLIGFGGTFTVKNAKVFHHVIKSNWEMPKCSKQCIEGCFRNWTTEMPVVGLATFVNTDRYAVMNSRIENIFLNQSQIHSYSNNCGGYYYRAEGLNNTTEEVEYLGYFSPATKLYRIDPIPLCTSLPSFSCLST